MSTLGFDFLLTMRMLVVKTMGIPRSEEMEKMYEAIIHEAMSRRGYKILSVNSGEARLYRDNERVVAYEEALIAIDRVSQEVITIVKELAGGILVPQCEIKVDELVFKFVRIPATYCALPGGRSANMVN